MSESATETAKTPGAVLRHLRALGHDLKPVVMLGKEGLTDGILGATRAALLAHELVKVKILSEAPVDRHEVASQLAEAAGAILAQVLGRTFLLYKRHPKKPKIVLPGEPAVREDKRKDPKRSLGGRKRRDRERSRAPRTR